jgi:hypothetical protein
MGQLLPTSPKTDDEVTPRLFSGELDEVALYDRVLDEKEIQEHFELGRPDRKLTEKQVSPKLQ